MLKQLSVIWVLVLAAVGTSATAAAPIPPAPTIDARAYLLIDAESGQQLAALKASDKSFDMEAYVKRSMGTVMELVAAACEDI